MAFTITSNTQSAEELNDVLLARGITPEPGEAVIPEANEKPDPAQASPGESPGGPTGKITPPASEPGEKPQESQEKKSKPEEKKPPVEAKPDAKFEPRRKQLERQVARLHEDLDLERGSKTALQAKLDAALADLEKLKPAAAEPVKSSDPVKPKRPTLAESGEGGYDQEAYEKNLQKYDEDLGAYYQAVSQKTVNDAIAEREQKHAEAAAKAEADRIFGQFVAKRDEDAAQIEDYLEAREEAGDIEIPDMVELAIIQSETPARLIHFFDRDKLDNDGKELARIARLDPVGQTREMVKIEMRLSNAEHPDEHKKPVKASKVVDEPSTPEVVPAAPPKPKAIPEAPIEPLGSRAKGRTPTLADAMKTETAGNFKEYMALRNQGVVR